MTERKTMHTRPDSSCNVVKSFQMAVDFIRCLQLLGGGLWADEGLTSGANNAQIEKTSPA